MFKKKSIGISNDNKKNKKIIIISAVSAVFVLAIIVLLTTGGLSKLMGNSVTEYYCEDPSYKLEGDKCVKEIREKSAFLGDVNLDNKITNEDLNLIQRYINYAEYDEPDEEVSKLKPIQIKAADVSEDNDVYNLDYDILNAYLGANASTHGISEENIGAKRICADDFTLDGIDCVKKDIVDAKIKTTEVSAKEDTNTNNNDSTNNSISKPIEISFKPQDNKKVLKVNSKYIIYVNFDVIDKSKQYYYVWTNYLYGEKNYSTECKKVIAGEHGGSFTVTGTRKANVSVYSDSSCRNLVNTLDSDVYKCDGCTNGIDVSIKPENQKTYIQEKTNYKMDLVFNQKDDNDYYYIKSDCLNGKSCTSVSCKKATPGEHDISFYVNGEHQIKVSVYNDSKCQNKIKEVNSEKYYPYSTEIFGIVDEEKKNPSVDVSLENITAITTSVFNNKKSAAKKIGMSGVLPNNTSVNIDFKIKPRDNSVDYYYTWDTLLNVPFPYSINGRSFIYEYKLGDCLKVPKSGLVRVNLNQKINLKELSHSGSAIDINSVNGAFTLYQDRRCKSYSRGIRYFHYYFQTFRVKYDANGGKILRNPVDSCKIHKTIWGNREVKECDPLSKVNYITQFYNFQNPSILKNMDSHIVRDGYSLTGFRVRNSKGQYICYSNSKKTSSNYAQESVCKKYGYFMYGPNASLITTTGTDEELITLIAQWKKN